MATVSNTEALRYFAGTDSNITVMKARRAAHSRISILEEPTFVQLLRLETKRTMRSSTPFMLMLLDIERLLSGAQQEQSFRWIHSALDNSIRDTDTLGWYQDRKQLGVIFTAIGQTKYENARIILGRICAALQQKLHYQDFESLHIDYRVFPEENVSIEEPVWIAGRQAGGPVHAGESSR